MVAQKKEVAGKDVNLIMKFNQQTAKDFPMYVVTCLDNEFNPGGTLEIMPFHERSDADAISYVADIASKGEWHSWEIHNDTGNYPVYKRNTNTGIEWSVLDAAKNKKGKAKKRDKRHGSNN